MDDDPDTFTFNSRFFSTYAIVYTDAEETALALERMADDAGNADGITLTGDGAIAPLGTTFPWWILWVLLILVLVAAGILLFVVIYRRKNGKI